jgi:hypothetical protein
MWEDDFLLNGYMIDAFVLKVNTLNARIFLFIEKTHPLV